MRWDGRLDLYLVNGAPYSDPEPKGSIPQKTGPRYWNRMYYQKADGTFEDITEKSGLKGVGYGLGVAVADYNNDGKEDVFVTSYGGNRLYHNNGDCTFTDVTDKACVAGRGWSTSATWVDLAPVASAVKCAMRCLLGHQQMEQWLHSATAQ